MSSNVWMAARRRRLSLERDEEGWNTHLTKRSNNKSYTHVFAKRCVPIRDSVSYVGMILDLCSDSVRCVPRASGTDEASMI